MSPAKLSFEYYLKLKKWINLVIDSIEGEDVESKKFEVEDDLFGSYEPKVFGGESGEEVKYIKSSNESLISLSKYLGYDASTMSALQFYQGLELAKRESDETKKMLKK